MDVVMAYLNRVAQDEQNNAANRSHTELASDNQRWGSRRIEITDVEICDGSGTPRANFVTGCPMEIRLSFRANERIEDPIFGLAIHQDSGTHIAGPNTNFGGLAIDCVEGDGQVVYRIPALPLLEGAYLVSVSSHNRADTEMYDYHDRAYPFRVYPSKQREGYGMVILNGYWQHSAGPEEPQTLTHTDLLERVRP
jgi:lipopolysaccharide transport system ATP-binding protein